MPIEIKELHIKAAVNNNASTNVPNAQSSSEGMGNDSMVQQCVEKDSMLQINSKEHVMEKIQKII